MAKIKGGTDYINLSSGHSRILGHKPLSMGLTQLHEALSSGDTQHVEEMGLGFFDASSPNYTTFYPDVKPEDFTPNEEDFIEPVYRALSNVTVHKNRNPVYFSEKVLKESMPLLVGQTINIDHETAIGNAIGSVKSVEWQNSYKLNGKEIPAGINMVMRIDAKSNPRIARGIQMDPPSIHSNSVTVQFTWEPSHPELDSNEFWNKLGTYDKDGKLIQRVVTKVVGYNETSLVNHGADPFAKQVKGGKIVHPTMAQRKYYGITANSEFSDYSTEVQKRAFCDHFMDFKNLSEDSEEAQGTIPETLINDNNTEQQNSEQMKQYLSKLTLMLIAAGANDPQVTEENFGEKFNELNTLINGLSAKAKENELQQISLTINGQRETDLGTIQNQITALENQATIGNEALADVRTRALNAYQLITPEENQDESMITLINTADFKVAKALKLQYENQVEKELPLTCKDCGSQNVNRASATVENNDSPEDGDSSEEVSFEEARERLREKHNSVPRFYRSEDNKE